MSGTSADTSSSGRTGEAPPARPPEYGLRVSDADREGVAQRLAEAYGEGRLTLAEFDERVRAAHAAVVRADLEPLLADLPARGGRNVEQPQRSARTGAGLAGSGVSGAGLSVPGRQAFGPSLPLLPFAGPCGAGGVRGPVAAWAVASVINFVIWVAVVVGTGAPVHPWWIWVAGPWGLALLLGAGARRAARPADGS